MNLRKRLVSLAISAAMMAAAVPFAVFAEEAEKPESKSFTYYDNATGKDTQGVYYYTDDYFAQPGTQDNEHLRTMSLALSIAPNGKNDKNGVYDILKDTGFDTENIAAEDMDKSEDHTIGTIISSKQLSSGSKLLVVYVRGLGYTKEWVDNLTIGSEGDAQGFAQSGQKVFNRIAEYEKNNGLKGAKIWMTGYSRGGAAADMAGKLINENLDTLGITADDLYAYTFSAPAASITKTEYKNIHDVIDAHDLVPRFLPAGWGFYRTGTEFVMPCEKDTIQPKTLDFMSGKFISDKTKTEKDPETGESRTVPADPIDEKEFLDKFFVMLSENASRTGFSSEGEVVPQFVKELILDAMDGNGVLLAFFKDTFAGITKDMNTLTMVLTLLSASTDSDEFKNAYENMPNIIASMVDNSPSKDKLTEAQLTQIKQALPAMIRIILGFVRSDLANTFETIATFIGNVSHIIAHHYPSNFWSELIKCDSYYTEKQPVTPGTLIYYGRQFEQGDYETMKQEGIPDSDIELLKQGIDIEYSIAHKAIDAQQVKDEDKAAVEKVIGCEISDEIFFDSYAQRSQTGSEPEKVEHDGLMRLIMQINPDGKDLTGLKFYIVKYSDGKARIVESASAAVEGMLYIGYNSEERGTYAFVAVKEEAERSGLRLRIKGKDRYETAMNISRRCIAADNEMGTKNFVIATGKKYPDALSAAYLAKVKNASILLAGDDNIDTIAEFIRFNATKDTAVYIIGGEGAVSGRLDKLLTTAAGDPLNVKRLNGKTRYETNLLVLKEAGVKNEDLLVVSGENFADAISASAANKPLLLVNGDLTDEQTTFIKELSSENAVIIGGSKAVSAAVETKITTMFKNVERIKGPNRYATSVAVAKKFFAQPKGVALAYGENFPDGIAGAPLAMMFGCPVILVSNENNADAADYFKQNNLKTAIAFGGTGNISDETFEKFR